MTFFDKLALALLSWGAVFAYGGGMFWSIYNSPTGKKVCLTGIALLALATLTWIFS